MLKLKHRDQMNKKLLIPVMIISMITLPGCHNKSIDTAKLSDLERLSTRTVEGDSPNVSPIRLQALRDTAMTIGAQSGLSDRAKQLNEMLETRARHLDQVFNFNAMMLEQNVLPPVLVESRDNLNLASAETIRIADMTYQIADQARFVTAPPTWRSYLAMDYKKPPIPNVTLLPKDQQERLVWRKYIDKGWKQGSQQAEAIFKENLARLHRDYNGMILYRKLLAQNIVSAPYVAKTNLGVTGGGSNIRVNDQVLRITALPTLQADSKRWKPAFSKQPK